MALMQVIDLDSHLRGNLITNHGLLIKMRVSMQIPLKITFKDIPQSDFVEARIREKAAKLERFAGDITSCRVTIETPHQHHHKGNLYNVKVDITLPGEEILATRNPAGHHAHEDIYVALRDAFNATQRQLEEYVRRRRGKVKRHESMPHGIIKEIFPNADYGVIETADGRELYFHRNSLLDEDMDRIEVGAHVHFTEESGEQGPQASSIHIEGKHHVT